MNAIGNAMTSSDKLWTNPMAHDGSNGNVVEIGKEVPRLLNPYLSSQAYILLKFGNTGRKKCKLKRNQS